MTRSQREHRFVNDLAHERDRQRQQWGGTVHDRKHTVSMWLVIVGVRFGKLCQAALHPTDSPANHYPARLSDGQKAILRYRLVQLAAVASAMAEQLGAEISEGSDDLSDCP